MWLQSSFLNDFYNILKLKVKYMSSQNKCGYLVSQILKFIDKSQQSSSESDYERKSSHQSSTINEQQEKDKKHLVLVKKEKNFYNRISRLTPVLKEKSTFKLFGFLGINQKSLENPDSQDNILRDYFESRVIEKVEIYEHAVVISLEEPFLPYQPSPDYLVEKYLSKGDSRFGQLGMDLKELLKLYNELYAAKLPSKKPQPIKKWLDYMGQGMYTVFLGPRKYAISKGLLTYLEYDIEQLGIQMVKYRSVLFELFSVQSYMACMKHFLKLLKYTALVSLGRINMQQFKEETYFKITDFIESKNHVRSYCDQSFYYLNTEFIVHQVDFIYYKTEALSGKMLMSDSKHQEIEMGKSTIKDLEKQTLNKIKYAQSGSKKNKLYLHAEYKDIEREVIEQEKDE